MDILAQQISVLSTWILPILLAITAHEMAHAFAAYKLGDDTAKLMGRVTMNPLKHMDMMGTIILPIFLFIMKSPFILGWAKPVPVVARRLHNPRRDMILVAAAGPFVNLVLAVLSALPLAYIDYVPGGYSGFVAQNLANSLKINVVLMVFNLLPIPPLDGGRIISNLLPPSWSRVFDSIEEYALFILVGVIFVLPLLTPLLGFKLDVFQVLVQQPSTFVLEHIATFAGLYE